MFVRHRHVSRATASPPATRCAPDSLYGVSEVAGEAVARLYAEKFGLQVACLRIGSCRPGPPSHDIATSGSARTTPWAAFVAAMTAPGLTHAVFYAGSANDLGRWDPGPGRAVGFHPRDNAERHPRSPAATYTEDIQGGDLSAAAYALERIANTSRS
jgi:uronate dehydrogenase